MIVRGVPDAPFHFLRGPERGAKGKEAQPHLLCRPEEGAKLYSQGGDGNINGDSLRTLRSGSQMAQS